MSPKGGDVRGMSELALPSMFTAHFLNTRPKKESFRWTCWIIFFCSMILIIALFTIIFDFRASAAKNKVPIGGLIGIGAVVGAVILMVIMMIIQFRAEQKHHAYHEEAILKGRQWKHKVGLTGELASPSNQFDRV